MISRILIYNSGGGIGDAIQILPLINSLKVEFKDAEFYYLCAHENHFNSSLKELNCNINTINMNMQYFGFRWWHLFKVKSVVKKNNIMKFDLIIDLQSKIRNSLILKMIPHRFFISTCFNFFLSNPNAKVKKNTKINITILDAINKILNTKCKIVDYNLNQIDKKYFDESIKSLENYKKRLKFFK